MFSFGSCINEIPEAIIRPYKIETPQKSLHRNKLKGITQYKT
jgi:hypothetical protein